MNSKKTFLDLVSEKSFMKKIVELQDEKEVIKVFENEGVTPTKEEMELLKNILNKTCDELEKHNKEELKEMSKTLDSLTPEQLLTVAGGEDPPGEKTTTEESSTGDDTSVLGQIIKRTKKIGDVLTPALTAVNDTVTNVGTNIVQPIAGAKEAEAKMQATVSTNETKRYKANIGLQVSNNKTKIAYGCIGAAVVITPMVIFRDEIKAWFRKK